jgi:hypothetical protein
MLPLRENVPNKLLSAPMLFAKVEDKAFTVKLLVEK